MEKFRSSAPSDVADSPGEVNEEVSTVCPEGAKGERAGPGLESHVLLNGDEPKALPKLSCGSVSDPDRRRFALVGVSRLAAEDAVCRSAGRVEGVVG